MNIESKQFTIEMSSSELWNTAWDIKYATINTLKTHWVNYQNTWQKMELERLNRMEKMFLHLGRPDLYQDIFTQSEEIFKEFNAKKELITT